jgi:hypothetical protein
VQRRLRTEGPVTDGVIGFSLVCQHNATCSWERSVSVG